MTLIFHTRILIILTLAFLMVVPPGLATEDSIEEPFIDPNVTEPVAEPIPGMDDTFPLIPEPESSIIGGDTGWFRITSNPTGARVIFDGSDIGTTPAMAEVYTTGSPYHTVKVTKSGYKPWNRELKENPESGETISIHADLIPDPCCMSLKITSGPSGAQILLNGAFQGNTPKTIENLIPGTYQVSLSREGYEPWHGAIEVGPDETNQIYVVLEPMFAPITTATVMVESHPAGAGIIVDGTNRGTTPRSVTLPEGSHSLVLTYPGYQEYKTSLYLRDKENTRMYVELIPTGSTTNPVIIIAEVPQFSYTADDLVNLGDQAAGYLERTGPEALISGVNNPEGQFSTETGFISVMAKNGTILAYPKAPEWAMENSTSYSDQNTVPYGQAQIILAEAGGGFLYENDISNTSSGGQLLVTAVRPETEELIIAASHPLGIPVPLFSASTIASLTSPERGAGPANKAIWEVTIPEDVTTNQNQEGESVALFNQTDQYSVRSLPLILALASENGGLCYIPEPSGLGVTLGYVFPKQDGKIIVRWIAGSDTTASSEQVVHS